MASFRSIRNGKGWKLVRDRKLGGNISVLYQKGDVSVELFKDALWGNTDNMNVIVRDKRIESGMSSLGKDVQVFRADSEHEAFNWAKAYMGSH